MGSVARRRSPKPNVGQNLTYIVEAVSGRKNAGRRKKPTGRSVRRGAGKCKSKSDLHCGSKFDLHSKPLPAVFHSPSLIFSPADVRAAGSDPRESERCRSRPHQPQTQSEITHLITQRQTHKRVATVAALRALGALRAAHSVDPQLMKGKR
jgi:hypothetical protein